jgi:hypothetical protein
MYKHRKKKRMTLKIPKIKSTKYYYYYYYYLDKLTNRMSQLQVNQVKDKAKTKKETKQNKKYIYPYEMIFNT